ncbi:MAG: phosphoribosylaminoimidazolesuccinocarboxamide synthase [bacterium]
MIHSPFTAHDSRAVLETNLSLPLYRRGKVRDVYEADGNLLIVATDRLSAFDHVLPTPIPGKGRILTQLSEFWFDFTPHIVPNHMITTDVDEISEAVEDLADVDRTLLEGRTMLVRRCERIDVECVVRGYITGSAWDEYRRTGAVADEPMPRGLRNGDVLPQPIFTPATKASHGHDKNITFAELEDLVGREMGQTLRELSLALYWQAAAHARQVGLILADTKFEFGLADDQIVLIDEALTPDSSRYWDAAQYPQSLASFDKQFVRDYLNQAGWNHEPPVPSLPDDVVEATRQRYLETFARLTGKLV